MEYFSHPAMSQSKLKDLKKSPQYFWAKHVAKIIQETTTPAMVFGTALHELIFEHKKFEENYVIEPTIDRRTKSGKEILERFIEDNTGKHILNESEMQILKNMQAQILKKKSAEIMFVKGIAEKELFWIDTNTDIECKAKLDYLVEPCEEYPHGLIIDLKTTQNASPSEFSKSIYNFGYHNQVAFYSEAIKTIYKTSGYPMFIFIAIEKQGLYDCNFFLANDDILTIGREENQKLLQLYKRCVNANNWPGYEDIIQTISLPKWAQNKHYFEEN